MEKTLMEMTFNEYMEQEYGIKSRPLTHKQLEAWERTGREARKDLEEMARKKRKGYEEAARMVLD